MVKFARLAVALLLTSCGEAPSSSESQDLVDFSAPCLALPSCSAPGPKLGPRSDWNHFSSNIVTLASAHHRGRDQLVVEGDPQWVVAKFAYGLTDKDLEGEDVDVFVLRGCGEAWEHLGTATTTEEHGQHEPVLGVEDNGGRVFFELPKESVLEVGRHRVRLVVRGDHTSTELFIQVVLPTASVFVTDVDGTLTTSEFKEFEELLEGELPEAHHAAADALGALARRGYLPIYLTARPEWLTNRTREFVKRRGFPPGVIHTTTTLTGALGSAAASFKENELAALDSQGFTPAWAFGNKPSDGDAYEKAGIQPLENRVFYGLDDTHGGRRIDDYAEIEGELADAPLCP
jgi:hypothetical protein